MNGFVFDVHVRVNHTVAQWGARLPSGRNRTLPTRLEVASQNTPHMFLLPVVGG